MNDSAAFWITVLGFTVTYAGLALGRLPGLRIDRTGIAVVGAAFFLATGVLTFAEAVEAVDHATLVLLDRVRPEREYRQIDWGLLVLFAGLFVVVHAFEVRVIRPLGLEHWGPLQEYPLVLLSVVSAALSNVVSNVPAVLLFRPVIPALAPPLQETAWLALAMSSTLAGNLTVLGSIANLIVVEVARREGTRIGFWEYCKAGIPVTLLTLLLGIGWLWFF